MGMVKMKIIKLLLCQGEHYLTETFP